MAAIAVAAPMAVSATPAAAATVGAATIACGATVTGPVSLSHDMHCSGDAVTLLGGQLNLRGHTISGDGSGTGVALAAPATGSASAAVVDGTVTNFASGIAGTDSGAVSLALDNVALTRNGTALDATSINVASLVHVRMKHNSGDAVVVGAPNLVSIHHSRITDNARGVVVIDDGQAEIDHTLISGNATGIFCSQGLLAVSQSTVSRNGTGAELFQCEGSGVTAVRFVDNEQAGIDVVFATSDVADPTLRVYRATFDGNGVGLHLGTDVTAVAVTNSSFSGNGTGILADGCTGSCPLKPDDTVAKSSFTRNAHDGVRWGYGTLRVYANTFRYNGGWGFFAAEGTTVINKGSNVARDNREGDCYRLACK